jgi:hypothetical protein
MLIVASAALLSSTDIAVVVEYDACRLGLAGIA